MIDSFVLIGEDTQHSKSPIIYNYFAEQHTKNIHYENFNLIYKDKLKYYIREYFNKGYKVMNITNPFKEDVYNMLKVSKCNITQRAESCKSVNLLTKDKDGYMLGDNTDGVGFIRDLIMNQKFSLYQKRILILGVGGVTKAILPYILTTIPMFIYTHNRTLDKCYSLVYEYKHANISVLNLTDNYIPKFDIVINTSTVIDIELVDKLYSNTMLSDDVLVYDVNYGEKGNESYIYCKKNNIMYCSGLGMLVEQAAEVFDVVYNILPETKKLINLL